MEPSTFMRSSGNKATRKSSKRRSKERTKNRKTQTRSKKKENEEAPSNVGLTAPRFGPLNVSPTTPGISCATKPSGDKVTRKSFLNHLRNKGFSPSDAAKAMDSFEEILRDSFYKGHAIYIRKVLKMTPRLQPPRIIADNIHDKKLIFGESIRYRIRVLALREENIREHEANAYLKTD